ncbi:hypothetical protein JCM33374_g2050 [Metschnikowia sp. JCM 33374]|nr:hypothetical protein JCM33374_g2050 [Metschnikowia sp. JCM 33374]
MTKVSRVFKLFKMKILKKAAGLRPKATGLVASKPTTPTEPSGVNFGEEPYKRTKSRSSKEKKPSKLASTEYSSSKCPSGAFATETATKTTTKTATTTTTTTTTTTNNNNKTSGEGFKGPIIFPKFSGLLKLDRVAKETAPAFNAVPKRSPHKEGKKDTPVALSFSVGQSVRVEEVRASAKGGEKTQEIPSEMAFDREVSQPEFSQTQTQTQTHEHKAGGTVHCATANGFATFSQNKCLRRKSRRYWKMRTPRNSILKMSRKVLGGEKLSAEVSPCKQAEAKGYKSRYDDGETSLMKTWLDQTAQPLARNKNASENQPEQDQVWEQNKQVFKEHPRQSQACEFCKIDGSGASGCADCPICYYYWTGIKVDGKSKLRSTLVPRNNFWWNRPTDSGARSFASTRDSFGVTKGVSEDGFCRLVSRKLHVDSVTRTVIGWSRKVRVAAKSSTGKSLAVHGNLYDPKWKQDYTPEPCYLAAAKSDFGGETASKLNSVVPCREQISGPGLSAYIDDTEELENETEETEDNDSIETLEDTGEIQMVRVCDGENERLQGVDGSPSDREAASGYAQIPPFKPFSSVILPISQLSDISSESEFEFSSEDTREIRRLSGHGIDASNKIGASSTENTPISGTSQICSEGNLKHTSSSSTSAAQKFISSVSHTFMSSCEASLKFAETTFLGERGLLQFLKDTKEEVQSSPPVSNFRQGNSGLEIEGETLPSEGPQHSEEKCFWTRGLSLATSNIGRGFMKELTLVGKRFSGVDAEGLENVPERNYAEENMEGSVLEKSLTRLEYSSLELTGLALGGIEGKTETEKTVTIDSDVSRLYSKKSEGMEWTDYSTLDVSSRPIGEKDTLWYLLNLTGQEDWQRIRNDFLEGEDLHILLEARSSLSSLPTMRPTVLEKANLGGNNECGNYCQRTKKISFSQQLEVTPTQKAPSKSILKKAIVPNKSDVGALKVFEQACTANEVHAMEKERLQKFFRCREAIFQFAGKQGLSELKEPLDIFASWISFVSINYVRVVKQRLLDYNHYLSEIRASLDTALAMLRSAGEQFCILVDFIGTTPKSPQSLLEVQEKIGFLMSSLSNSDTVLQGVQNALKQMASKDFDYANTMKDLLKKTMGSQRDICDTYKMFLRFFIHDTAEISVVDIITGFGDFEKEMESLNNPSNYGISKIDKLLISLQTCCNIVNRGREDLETRTKQIIAGVSKLKCGGLVPATA